MSNVQATPIEYLADPKKSPRTMDNFGMYSRKEVLSKAVDRVLKVWFITFALYVSLVVLVSVASGWDINYALAAMHMIIITSIQGVFYLPYTVSKFNAYYKPVE